MTVCRVYSPHGQRDTQGVTAGPQQEIPFLLLLFLLQILQERQEEMRPVLTRPMQSCELGGLQRTSERDEREREREFFIIYIILILRSEIALWTLFQKYIMTVKRYCPVGL
jgi:hypothetical protein